MSAYLNIYRVLSAAVLWGMENNHGITVHFIILNLPITIRVKQFWWDNVTVHRRWSFKGDGGKDALMADTGFHFYHDHLLEFWWLREVLNTTTERKSREKPRTMARTRCCDWTAGTRDEGMEEERGMKGRGHPNRRDKGWLGQRDGEYNDTVRSSGFPWWSSGQEFTATAGAQDRSLVWKGATGQLSQHTTAPELLGLDSGRCSKSAHHSENQAPQQRVAPLPVPRESPCAAKNQCIQK